MAVNADFRDLFRILRACRVRYLVAGAHAAMFHSRRVCSSAAHGFVARAARVQQSCTPYLAGMKQS